MAVLGHKTESGIRYEMSGGGFHSPSKYGKNDRLNKHALNDELSEALEELEEMRAFEDDDINTSSDN